MAVRGGLNPFLWRTTPLLNRRRLSVAFIAIQIEYRKAYVAISFSVSSGKSFEVGDVTD